MDREARMIGIRWVGSVALLIGLAVSDAGASAPDCEEVRRFTLENGLEVLLLSDARLPSVALVASIHAGARHDPGGARPGAHLTTTCRSCCCRACSTSATPSGPGCGTGGATYGIHARVDDGNPGGVLLELEGQVAPDEAQAALRRLVEDIRALSATLDERELEEVKRGWRTAFVNSLANDAALARVALWQLRRGRPLHTLKAWPEELSQVSLVRCRHVATRWLNAAQPSIAVTGLPVQLVRGLGLAADVREYYWTDELQERKKAL
jgi:predicted Zn-dependent peptidase